MEKYLTRKEFCKLFKISPMTLHRWIKKGEIEYMVLREGKRKKTIRFKVENPEEEYFTKKEVCEMLGISISTLYLMMKDGRINYVVIKESKGRRVIRFTKKSLDALRVLRSNVRA